MHPKDKKELLKFISYISIILIIFSLYVGCTYNKPELEIVDDEGNNITELANSPFMDHTHDVKNYVRESEVLSAPYRSDQ